MLRIRTNKNELFFLAIYAVYISLLFVYQTEFLVTMPEAAQLVFKVARYTCYLMFMIKILGSTSYKVTYLIGTIVIMSVVFICMLSSDINKITILAIVCIAAYGCDYRKIIKITTIVFLAGLVFTIFLCDIGIVNNLMLDTARKRYNLGFNWVTLPNIYFFIIVLGIINIRRERLTLIEIVLMLLFNYWLFHQTDTRLAFLLTTTVLLFTAFEKTVMKWKWKYFRRLGNILPALPVIICTTTFIVAYMYTPGNTIWDSINKALSGRLLLSYNNLHSLPMTLFGQRVEWHGNSLKEGFLTGSMGWTYNNVDCSYLRIYFDYGIIGLTTVLSLFTLGIKKAKEIGDQFLLFSYIMILIFSITEQWMIELSFNPFILIAAASLSVGNTKNHVNSQRSMSTWRY